jgi:aminoglycoside phosphotransferase (APT) family kinase protein
VGDPACDLAIAWTFLEDESREAFRASVPADDAMWARARGWALWKAALLMAQNDATNSSEASPAVVTEAVLAEHAQSA